ncbi:MAG: beta-aspartyl-peptidase [Oscillospiraceae bacterium]|nr:beta-aspartyl-peptidase [Oscillospiraceae bacterium]
MFKLIKNGHVYSPEDLGVKDILLWEDRVIKIGEDLKIPEGFEGKEFDLSGKIIIPGIVDTHVHITGGGGEGGFTTRTSEITFEEIAEAGVTTLVGVLGTDGYARRVEDVLVKCMALREEGFDCYFLTGSYTFPITTMRGSVAEDIIFNEYCLGTGEVAHCDHRGSLMRYEEFTRLAADTRNGARLAGIKGVLNIHLGNYSDPADFFIRACEEDITFRPLIVPTHVTRKYDVFDSCLKFLEYGGQIDITAGSDGDASQKSYGSVEGLEIIYKKYGTLDRVTMTSDGNGSAPIWDELGNMIGMGKGSSKVLLADLKKATKNGIIPFEETLRTITTIPAEVYGLKNSAGKIVENGTANFAVLDENLDLVETILNGKRVWIKGKGIVK